MLYHSDRYFIRFTKPPFSNLDKILEKERMAGYGLL